MPTLPRLVGSLLTIGLVWGCSTSATLRLRDGSEVEGSIANGTPDAVWLKTGQVVEPEQLDTARGTPVVVERYFQSRVVGVLSRGTAVSRIEDGRPMAWDRVCVEPFDTPNPGLKKPRACLASDEVISVERSVRVPRGQIADVSHPGTGAIVVGGVLLGIAGFFTVRAFTASDKCDVGAGFCVSPRTGAQVLAVVFGVPGLSIETFGLGAYFVSRSRYAPPEAPAPPTAMQATKGVRVGFEF
jgi:hypothetical protein